MQSNQFVQSKMQFVQSKMRNCASKNTKFKTTTTMRLRPRRSPGPHWAERPVGFGAPAPDPLAGKGEGPPGWPPGRGNPGKGREGKEGEGKNCFHQMSDFTAKTPNSISAGVPPQIPMGSLQRYPRPLAGFKGLTSLQTCLLLTHVALCQRARGRAI